jgi:hypothetical protein
MPDDKKPWDAIVVGSGLGRRPVQNVHKVAVEHSRHLYEVASSQDLAIMRKVVITYAAGYSC